jgi:5'(3')-deoxyribonucleotidase
MKKHAETIVLIDLDDTLTDLLGTWVANLNKRYNLSVRREEIRNWDICQFFPTLTHSQVFEPLFTPDFWDSIKPKNDAVKYVKKLKDEGYRIFVCTNSNYETLKEKMDKVLFKYFDFLSWRDVIITCNKQIINADILIDDCVYNLIGGKYKKILMTAPHNIEYDAEKNDIVRVNSWKEIYDEIIKNLNFKRR